MENNIEIITEVNPADLGTGNIYDFVNGQLELGYNITYGLNIVTAGLIFILNESQNTIEYSYWYRIEDAENKDNGIDDCIEVATVIPHEIKLDAIEDEQSAVAKLMYSKTDYFKYLILNKIDLNYLKAIMLDQIESEIYNTESQIKHDIQNPLNLKTERARIIAERATNSYSLKVDKFYKGRHIVMNMEFTYPDDNRLKVIYTYKIHNQFTENYNEFRDCTKQYEVSFSWFELVRYSYERKSVRLVEVYHIVDDVFREEISKANQVLNKTKNIGVIN
jgi:ribosomal protein S10